ncbi:hypothetical protein CR513_10508, partial [Mucuna pruriens]
MVKKASGKWRMCTDYTDLNKACPKDPYPLPSIDRLVDGVSGFALLSFMDAYSGYNQIQMHPHDEEKTAFITDAGAFCYKVMPFGLKNARATYQRLMEKIFKEVMGVDVEVYVDDMVVKSIVAVKHCKALERVFGILRKHQLRLNPEKCSFEVHAGKFLGFMLTKRGIEVNLEKCQAVIGMRSPQSIKKVQQLMGKRPKQPCPSLEHSRREETLFGRLNAKKLFAIDMLATPLVLTHSDLGTPLYLYISVSDVEISVMLIQEREGVQRPIYFTSKVLQGVERRYQKIEKAALALATPILSKLWHNRPNGSSNPSSVVKAESSRENGGLEHPATEEGSRKAQALADFITELTLISTPTTKKREWYLSVDGSSNQIGNGVGVILEGPEGVLIEQSLHFEFKASNNQAEYEALLAGMGLA